MSRLSHVIAFTKNFDAMREFFAQQVGLGIRQQEPRWVAFETAGACLGLLDMPDPRKQGLALRFETADLDAQRRAIAERGGRAGEPIAFAGGRLSDVWDPEGILVQFQQPARPLAAGGGTEIGRVILNVRDFARSVSFYRNTLGFPVADETPHWVEFDTGGTRLAVHHRPVGGEHPRHAEQPVTLVFGSDDLTAWVEEMRGRGLHFMTAPVLEEFGVYAEAADPDGRIVVFHEPPPPESLEEELAEAWEDDGAPQRSAMRKPVKKGSATVSMMALKPAYKSKAAPGRRRPSATTQSVVSVKGAGPEGTRLRPKRTADEKKARAKPAIGRLRKAELKISASHRTAAARASKSRPVKRGSANAARRRGSGRGKAR